MKSRLTIVAVFVLCVSVATPGQESTPGTIISMQSVDCGSKKEGKNKSTSLVCQQYVVRTPTTEYQIRQPKPAEQAVLPANTPIQFTLKKDKMKFKVNGKTYEFLVVGTSALQTQ